jgi:hypothetical protein
VKWWEVPFIVLILVVSLPAILLVALGMVSYSMALHVVIWIVWCARGRDILFVSSDSPVWGSYVSENLLPGLGDRVVFLNWSERKKWRLSVASVAFHHFGGRQEFNPMAVVFRPFHRTRTFRFWKAFRDWKHGDHRALHQIETDFLKATRTRPHSA